MPRCVYIGQRSIGGGSIPNVMSVHRGIFLAALLAVIQPGAAHHSPAAFDGDAVISVRGTVTRFDFRNPHVYIYMESEDDNGTVTAWEIESDWMTELRRLGWTSDSLVPGDEIVVQAHPARNPARHYMNLISLEKQDGTVLTSWDLRPDEAPRAQERSNSLAGRWLPDRSFLRFYGLANQAANPAGRAAAESFTETQNPGAQCAPHPLPQRLGHPHVNDIEVFDDRVVITAESTDDPRVVYLDGRAFPADAEPAERGHSVGHWDGDVLVVETTHFADHRKGNGAAIPSGPRKRLTERYALAEDGTQILVDYVLEDPDYLSEPVVDQAVWRYAPHMELNPYSCDRDVAERYLQGEP